jgi:2-polyprenyl-3-methyl-5-hydroxy-6-metoxy-1,4-benzoquinol methylase
VSPAALWVWKQYQTLSWGEQLFVQGRLLTAPLDALAAIAAAPSVAEIGCGHGVLCALLKRHGAAHVIGVDPDARKIAWARKALGDSAELQVGTVQSLVQRGIKVDSVIVADVVYLLPRAEWVTFLRACRMLLNSNGRLYVKEAVDDGSWKAIKADWQERLMVRVFKRTHSSGGLRLPKPAELEEALRDAGFAQVQQKVFGGYTTAHQLFGARIGSDGSNSAP